MLVNIGREGSAPYNIVLSTHGHPTGYVLYKKHVSVVRHKYFSEKHFCFCIQKQCVFVMFLISDIFTKTILWSKLRIRTSWARDPKMIGWLMQNEKSRSPSRYNALMQPGSHVSGISKISCLVQSCCSSSPYFQPNSLP